eukprot:3993546-Amphidinium_carterae.1
MPPVLGNSHPRQPQFASGHISHRAVGMGTLPWNCLLLPLYTVRRGECFWDGAAAHTHVISHPNGNDEFLNPTQNGKTVHNFRVSCTLLPGCQVNN